MFESAVNTAMAYTRPLLTFIHFEDGTAECHLAAFILLNRAGWVLTSAHNLEIANLHRQHSVEREAHAQAANEIAARTDLDAAAKQSQIDALPRNDRWITRYFLCFAQVAARVETAIVAPGPDLALIRLVDFDMTGVPTWPVFQSPSQQPSLGASVCRLGYPFVQLQTTFDLANQAFDISKIPAEIPTFVNDGVISRFHQVLDPATNQVAMYIETSTPGLRGQSGGPLLDRHGVVCGLQSRTIQYDLGFDAAYRRADRVVTERQFLNVGLATAASEIVKLLSFNGVQFAISNDPTR